MSQPGASGQTIRPDIDRAIDFALKRLETDLSGKLYYHGLAHTRDDVLPAAVRLGELAGISDEEMALLRVGAAFHDIGFIDRREGHELAGAAIAYKQLSRFGFSAGQIEIIRRIILATRLPQTPHTLLEALMADADLDLLGREDFMSKNEALRREMAAYGQVFDDSRWYHDQLQFLKDHQYFTEAARSLRQAGKQRNIELLQRFLNQLS